MILAVRELGRTDIVGVCLSERGADGRWHDNLLMDLLREEFAGDDPPVDRGRP
jgi:hypothetical protein